MYIHVSSCKWEQLIFGHDAIDNLLLTKIPYRQHVALQGKTKGNLVHSVRQYWQCHALTGVLFLDHACNAPNTDSYTKLFMVVQLPRKVCFIDCITI